ncbi:MAG: glycosyltransferase [Bradyrhizobiaceae bacterium]|nr:glycosyltransferase [Bradyrhizobiaceae bacterium]
MLSNLLGGGAERATINLAKGLTSRGHESHIILLEQLAEYSVPPAVKVHALTVPGYRRPGGWLGKRLMSWKLRRLHRALGSFDLVLSTLPLADEVVRHANLPNVHFRIANNLSVKIAAMENLDKAARRLRRYRWIYDEQRLIAVSKGVATDLREGLGLSRAAITTIYNPFDFDEIRTLSKAVDPDLPERPYIIHAGRFQRQKRHDLLLDAFKAAALPHQLVLLTAPSAELTALIASRGLEERVTVAGFRENPFPWYANAAALVLSSDREGMPNMVIEALICGTPVVSTDCPSGPAEILTGSMRRWLVPCGDAAALATRMREVVESPPAIDPALLERFSKDAAFNAIEALAR